MLELHDQEKAAPIYESILAKYPQTPFFVEAKVWLKYINQTRRGIRKEDVAIYQQIIADYPEHRYGQAMAQYMIGWTYFVVKEWDF